MPEKIAISAIICEFDPLHLGHRALLQAAKRESGLVCCVLSGNYVQRGGPAMLDKWSRTGLALANGADLVFELPLSFACAGAERFALGGTALALALGADALWLGSEEPDAALLTRLAQALLSPDFSQKLKETAGSGLPFARRRQRALAALVGDSAGVLELPNANLGVEYIKSILLQGGKIEIRTIPRIGAGHGEVLRQGGATAFRSASELRRILAGGGSVRGLVPDITAEILENARSAGRFPALESRLETAMLARLRTMEPEEFAALPDISEGLENRLYKAGRQARSLEEFFALAKTKRYSYARLRRLAAAAFLGLKTPLPPKPAFLRVLGMTSRGQKLLGRRTGLPIAVRPEDFRRLGGQAWEDFLLEARADDLYALALPEIQPAGRDFTQGVVKLSDGNYVSSHF